LVVLGTAFFLQGLGITGTNVHTYAIRQAVTPVAMLGRSSAAYRVLTYGFVPLGALLGGLLGEAIGLRPALLVSALVLFPSWCWLFFSPARSLRTLPNAPETAA
jgi:MFS family permease